MSTADDLARELRDELGVDAQYLYGPERHFPVPAEVIQFALELLMVYLTSLLGIEEIAEKHRKALKDFVARIRAGRAPAADREARGEADALVEKTRGAGQLDYDAARRNLAEALVEVGVPRRAAERHAAEVAERFRGRLGN